MRQKSATKLTVRFFDGFVLFAEFWDDLFEDDMDHVVWDTHRYLACFLASGHFSLYWTEWKSALPSACRSKFPLWVGECYLATDGCAFWPIGPDESLAPLQTDLVSVWPFVERISFDFDRSAEKTQFFRLKRPILTTLWLLHTGLGPFLGRANQAAVYGHKRSVWWARGCPIPMESSKRALRLM